MAYDSTYQTPIYSAQESGTQTALEQFGPGSRIEVNGVPIVMKVTFTVAAGGGGSNQSNVTIQMQDQAGANLAFNYELEWYLSDSALGAGVTATTPSTSAGAGSAGYDIFAKVSKIAGDSITDNTGKYVLAIVDTGKTHYYVACAAPGTGILFVSAQLATASYG